MMLPATLAAAVFGPGVLPVTAATAPSSASTTSSSIGNGRYRDFEVEVEQNSGSVLEDGVVFDTMPQLAGGNGLMNRIRKSPNVAGTSLTSPPGVPSNGSNGGNPAFHFTPSEERRQTVFKPGTSTPGRL